MRCIESIQRHEKVQSWSDCAWVSLTTVTAQFRSRRFHIRVLESVSKSLGSLLPTTSICKWNITSRLGLWRYLWHCFPHVEVWNQDYSRGVLLSPSLHISVPCLSGSSRFLVKTWLNHSIQGRLMVSMPWTVCRQRPSHQYQIASEMHVEGREISPPTALLGTFQGWLLKKTKAWDHLSPSFLVIPSLSHRACLWARTRRRKRYLPMQLNICRNSRNGWSVESTAPQKAQNRIDVCPLATQPWRANSTLPVGLRLTDLKWVITPRRWLLFEWDPTSCPLDKVREKVQGFSKS